MFQRYGPPPSYPHLKIPGLNAPIPPGASFGYHPGGWGKPPVDEVGVLYFCSTSCSFKNTFLSLSAYAAYWLIFLCPCCFVDSMDVHCMEMSLVFNSKSNQIMMYVSGFFVFILASLLFHSFYKVE